MHRTTLHTNQVTTCMAIASGCAGGNGLNLEERRGRDQANPRDLPPFIPAGRMHPHHHTIHLTRHTLRI
eukprot:2586152-Pyramimonas_sp.AAC.1